MLSYRYPVIAREGWLWIFIVVIAAGVTHVLYGQVSFLLWFLALLLLFLFRDPFRKIPALPLGIVCPVDGRVVAVEKVHDAYLDRSAVCISIKMGFTSVYSAHSPMEGKIIEQWLGVPRKIYPLATVKNSGPATEVTTYAQWIQSDEQDDLVLVMEASTLLSRPQCYASSGERIGQGQRCGFLRFGTQVDVLVPETTRIDVNVGDKVLAGTGIIATLVHAEVVTKPPAEAVNA